MSFRLICSWLHSKCMKSPKSDGSLFSPFTCKILVFFMRTSFKKHLYILTQSSVELKIKIQRQQWPQVMATKIQVFQNNYSNYFGVLLVTNSFLTHTHIWDFGVRCDLACHQHSETVIFFKLFRKLWGLVKMVLLPLVSIWKISLFDRNWYDHSFNLLGKIFIYSCLHYFNNKKYRQQRFYQSPWVTVETFSSGEWPYLFGALTTVKYYIIATDNR